MKVFEQKVEADDGSWHYEIEELYQIFKSRLIKELAVRADELLNDAEIIDTSEG